MRDHGGLSEEWASKYLSLEEDSILGNLITSSQNLIEAQGIAGKLTADELRALRAEKPHYDKEHNTFTIRHLMNERAAIKLRVPMNQ